MNKFMKKIMSKKDGFTLVELIVVIAILAILAGVAVPAYSGYIDKANEAADITELDAIKTAAMAAYATTGEVKTVIITVGTDKAVSKVEINDGTNTVTVYPAASTPTDIQEDFGTFVSVSGRVMQSKKFAGGAVWNGTEWVKK